LLDLVRRKSVPPIPVSKRPLHQAQQSLEDLRDGKLVGRAVLTP
jgi:D-arabinose 1-dehydrogenase-like Zn-dependent alcohol dehydrogenase